MAFCGKCGSPVEDGKKFCGKCGNAVFASPAVTQTPTSFTPPQNTQTQVFTPVIPTYEATYVAAPPKPRKKLSKKTIITLCVSAAVVVMLIVTGFVLNSINSPENALDNLLDALKNKDAAAVSEYIVCSDSSVKVTKSSVEPLVRLYNEDNSFKYDFDKALRNATFGTYSVDNMINMQEGGFFVFKSYNFEINPTAVSFSSNLDDTKVTLGEYELTLADNDIPLTSDPILPGRYDIKAVATDSVTGVEFNYEQTESLYSYSSSDPLLYHSIEFSYSDLTIYTPRFFTLKSIVINDKEVADINQFYRLGDIYDSYDYINVKPIQTGAQVDIVCSTPLGGETTQTFNLDGYGYYQYFYYEPEVDEKTQTALMNMAVEYINKCVEAYNAKDVATLSKMLEERYTNFASNMLYQLDYEAQVSSAHANMVYNNITTDRADVKTWANHYTINVSAETGNEQGALTPAYFYIEIDFDADTKNWIVTGCNSYYGSIILDDPVSYTK